MDATSSATDMRPQATSSERWFVFRKATRAVDWTVSWTRETSAWFVAIDSPVTIAWSNVGRGIRVRWNVSGTFAAASSIPDWSARWRSDWTRGRRGIDLPLCVGDGDGDR